MKKSLLFLITATTLITGISCSDDNTDFDPTSDELGILYKDGHDVYGVEVWTPEFGGFPRSEKKIISIGIIQLLLQ